VAVRQAGATVERNGMAVERDGMAVTQNGAAVKRSSAAVKRNGTAVKRVGATIEWNGTAVKWNGHSEDTDKDRGQGQEHGDSVDKGMDKDRGQGHSDSVNKLLCVDLRWAATFGIYRNSVSTRATHTRNTHMQLTRANTDTSKPPLPSFRHFRFSFRHFRSAMSWHSVALHPSLPRRSSQWSGAVTLRRLSAEDDRGYGSGNEDEPQGDKGASGTGAGTKEPVSQVRDTKIYVSVYSIFSVEQTSGHGTLHYIGLRGYFSGDWYTGAISLISENVPGSRPSHIL